MEPYKNDTQKGFYLINIVTPNLNHGLSRELKGVVDGLRYNATLENVNSTISTLKI